MMRYFITVGLIFVCLFSKAQPEKTKITDPLFIKAQQFFAAFQYDSALYCYEKVLQEYRKADDKRRIATTLKGIGDALFYQKKYNAALPVLEEAIQIWKQLGDDKEIATAQTSVGAVYMDQGNHAASRDVLRQAIRTLSKLDDKNALLTAYLNLGANDSRDGNYPSAIESYLASLKMAEALGNKKMMAYNYLNLSSANLQINEPERALNNLENSLRISQEIGDKPATAISHLNMSLVLKSQHKFAEARKQLTLAIPIFQDLKDYPSLQAAQMNLGRIYEAEGDYEKALTTYLEADEMMNRSSTVLWLKVGNYQYIANMYNKLQQPSKARLWLEKALTIAKELKSDAVYADVYSHMSETDSLAGNYDRALHHYKQHILYKEKVFNEKNIKKTATLELQYMNERKSDSLKFVNQQQQLALQKEIQLASIRHEYETKQARTQSEAERLQLQQEEALKRQAIESEFKMAQLKSDQEQVQLLAQQQKQEATHKIKIQSEKNLRNLSLAGLLLITIVGGLLFYQNRVRRKTNTTLLTLNNELDEANKIKTKFFGILSHDLRSPIVNLINFLHLQKEMPDLFDKEREALHQKQLTQSAENLLETMEAMLLWSKSQMEHFAPQKKTIPVQDLFEFLRKQFYHRGIDFQFQAPDWLLVSSDEDYLKTIMYNLTSNAVKALAHTENPRIIWKGRQNGNHVELSITDNGPGVHEEQLEALYNENAVVSTRHGLGLHLIRDLAKAINCQVFHQSDLERGSVFQLIM